MGYVTRTAVATAATFAALAVPAQAGQVIVVDGSHAQRVDDPMVPTRAEAALPMPGRARAGAAAAASRV